MLEKLLNKIIKIDKEAEEKLETAKKEIEKINIDLQNKKEAMIKKIKQEAEEKLEDFKKKEKKIFEEEINKINSKYELDHSELEKKYYENLDYWAKKLAFEVTSSFTDN